MSKKKKLVDLRSYTKKLLDKEYKNYTQIYFSYSMSNLLFRTRVDFSLHVGYQL